MSAAASSSLALTTSSTARAIRIPLSNSAGTTRLSTSGRPNTSSRSRSPEGKVEAGPACVGECCLHSEHVTEETDRGVEVVRSRAPKETRRSLIIPLRRLQEGYRSARPEGSTATTRGAATQPPQRGRYAAMTACADRRRETGELLDRSSDSLARAVKSLDRSCSSARRLGQHGVGGARHVLKEGRGAAVADDRILPASDDEQRVDQRGGFALEGERRSAARAVLEGLSEAAGDPSRGSGPTARGAGRPRSRATSLVGLDVCDGSRIGDEDCARWTSVLLWPGLDDRHAQQHAVEAIGQLVTSRWRGNYRGRADDDGSPPADHCIDELMSTLSNWSRGSATTARGGSMAGHVDEDPPPPGTISWAGASTRREDRP